MPELGRIESVRIFMHLNDHGPPHIHVVHGKKRDRLFFEELLFEKGNRLKKRHERKVLKWARDHQSELRRAWAQASNNQHPDPID